ERVALFDAQFFELIERANDLRVIDRVSQAAQSDDGVHHRRKNCSQAIAHFKVLEQPLLSLVDCNRAQRTDVNPLKPVSHPVECEKEIPPGDQLFSPVQVHSSLVATAYEQFFYAHLVGDFLEWLLRVTD